MNDNTSSVPSAMSDEECMQRNKAALLLALKGIGATRANVIYSGSGDEGYVDSVEAYGKNRTKVSLQGTVSLLQNYRNLTNGRWFNVTCVRELPIGEALTDFTMDVLSIRCGGWEINEGADGTLSFCVEDGEATLAHNYRITNTEEIQL